MNEALRNFTVLLWAVCAINSNSYAGSNKVTIREEPRPAQPTVIIGEALTPSGRMKKRLLNNRPELLIRWEIRLLTKMTNRRRQLLP